MWVLQYVRELFVWAFGRWRLHQAAVALLLSVAAFFGLNRFAPSLNLGSVLLLWLVVLVLVVAPARLWRDQRSRLQPGLDFVEHGDDNVVDPNSDTQYARLRVRNRSAVLLTGVEVLFAEIEPRPQEFTTLNFPLIPLYATSADSRFSLQPYGDRAINVLSMEMGAKLAQVWVAIEGAALTLPLGRYRAKLVVSANEVIPSEQWFDVEVDRSRSSQTLSLSFSTGHQAG
jgi:hypothetical protein